MESSAAEPASGPRTTSVVGLNTRWAWCGPGFRASEANFALAEGGDTRLNEWMRARLSLAVWPAPADMTVPLKDVETALIVYFAPPINLDKNPNKLARLSAARSEMAVETAAWRRSES